MGVGFWCPKNSSMLTWKWFVILINIHLCLRHLVWTTIQSEWGRCYWHSCNGN